jgi:hypothetical protein
MIVMGNETTELWYRGEKFKAPPAAHGKFDHDFGDGMYLSDRIEVARIYAKKRTFVPAEERVWLVTLERKSLGRVLDLNMDSRWSRFMNEPMIPGKKNSQNRITSVRIEPNTYNTFFKEFLALNKIDIDRFDAVIGPEYILGGTQLCILNKNKRLSALARRVRVLFRPSTSLIRPPANGRILKGVIDTERAGLKIRILKGIGFVSATGLTMLFAYLMNKATQTANSRFIDKQIKGFQPEIEASLQRQRRKMFELADSGNKAYAIVNFRIETYDSLDVDAEGGGWTESVPVVKLMWIDIRSYKKEGPGKETETASFGQRFHSKPQTTSFELPVPKEDLDQYRAMMEELAWYDQALRDPSLFPSDVTQLSTEKKPSKRLSTMHSGILSPRTRLDMRTCSPTRCINPDRWTGGKQGRIFAEAGSNAGRRRGLSYGEAVTFPIRQSESPCAARI